MNAATRHPLARVDTGSQPRPGSATTAWLICFFLAALTIVAYWQVHQSGFVAYDDPEYVTRNVHLQNGVNWTSIFWAVTASYAMNWHPVTWLSHLIDYQLFGLHPAGHHLVNLALHVANTLLLFLLLCRLTGQPWPSAMVGLWFGLHPAHVESVAWVAERKDVLSAFFGLLALWAYANYVRRKTQLAVLEASRRKATTPTISWLWYCSALGFFILGLMSKPMLVTLPFWLLLLDYWPLGRFQPTASDQPASSFRLLLREKLPFVVLALLSCGVTIWAQHAGGSLIALQDFPVSHRIANALLSYWRYVRMLVWPSRLAVYYPYRGDGSLWLALLAGAALMLVSLAAIRTRKIPSLATGWLWFAISLVPVIGLVQVGTQAMADRYTYLPSVGIFIAVAFALDHFAACFPHRGVILSIVAGFTLIPCLTLTHRQVSYWRDSESLFRHAIDVTVGNDVAYNNLGTTLQAQGNVEEARACYRQALKLRPDQDQAHNNLGQLLLAEGRLDEARAHFQQALQSNPRSAIAYYNLGTLLLRQGNTDAALAAYRQATALRNDWPEAHNNLGGLLAAQGKWDAAIAEFREALRFQPNLTSALNNLGSALTEQSKASEAVPVLLRAIRSDPEFANAHYNLGNAYAKLNRVPEAAAEYQAVLSCNPKDSLAHYKLANLLLAGNQPAAALEHYRAALTANPDYAEAHYQLAVVLAASQSAVDAILHFRRAIELRPTWIEPLNNLAWLFATHPDSRCRDGLEAERLATQAATLTLQADAEVLDTLAAAQAEAGHFDQAVATAERASALAGQSDLAHRIQAHLELYRHQQPCRQ